MKIYQTKLFDSQILTQELKDAVYLMKLSSRNLRKAYVIGPSRSDSCIGKKSIAKPVDFLTIFRILLNSNLKSQDYLRYNSTT